MAGFSGHGQGLWLGFAWGRDLGLLGFEDGVEAALFVGQFEGVGGGGVVAHHGGGRGLLAIDVEILGQILEGVAERRRRALLRLEGDQLGIQF